MAAPQDGRHRLVHPRALRGGRRRGRCRGGCRRRRGRRWPRSAPCRGADRLGARHHLRDLRARHRDVLGELERVERLQADRERSGAPPRARRRCASSCATSTSPAASAPTRSATRTHLVEDRASSLPSISTSSSAPAPAREAAGRGAGRWPPSETSSISSRLRGMHARASTRETARAAASSVGEGHQRGGHVARAAAAASA